MQKKCTQVCCETLNNTHYQNFQIRGSKLKKIFHMCQQKIPYVAIYGDLLCIIFFLNGKSEII